MEPLTIGILGLVILFVLLAIGIHIGIVLIGVGFIGVLIIMDFEAAVTVAVSTIFHQATFSPLVIIPLFTFMGLLAASAGISANIYKALSLWMGKFKEGLGIATVFSCAAFGTITGSALVCAAVFAKVSAPEMRKQGYDKRLAYGICASAGTIGMLIPPSIFMVIWALLTEESVGRLLIAGIGPGLILVVLFSLGIIVMGRLRPALVGSTSKISVTWWERFAAIRLFWPVAIIASIMLGGIFFGVFSPTEASAIAAIVVLVMTIIITGKERWSAVKNGLRETATVTAMIFLILVGALVLSRFFSLAGVTNAALGFILDLNLSPVVFVLVMAGVYIIMGMFLDGISMMAITLPVIYPAVLAMGIHPIWFAMVSITAIQLGGITPPVGLLCYTVKGVAEPDVSLEDIFVGTFPFFFFWVLAIGIMIAFPSLTTILPNLMWK